MDLLLKRVLNEKIKEIKEAHKKKREDVLKLHSVIAERCRQLDMDYLGLYTNLKSFGKGLEGKYDEPGDPRALKVNKKLYLNNTCFTCDDEEEEDTDDDEGIEEERKIFEKFKEFIYIDDNKDNEQNVTSKDKKDKVLTKEQISEWIQGKSLAQQFGEFMDSYGITLDEEEVAEMNRGARISKSSSFSDLTLVDVQGNANKEDQKKLSENFNEFAVTDGNEDSEKEFIDLATDLEVDEEDMTTECTDTSEYKVMGQELDEALSSSESIICLSSSDDEEKQASAPCYKWILKCPGSGNDPGREITVAEVAIGNRDESFDVENFLNKRLAEDNEFSRTLNAFLRANDSSTESDDEKKEEKARTRYFTKGFINRPKKKEKIEHLQKDMLLEEVISDSDCEELAESFVVEQFNEREVISDSDCEELAESFVVKQFNEREVISDSDCEELAESSVVKQFNEREVISDSDCEELAESSVVKQFNELEVISDSDCEELAESSVVKQFNEREVISDSDCEELAESSVVKQFNEREVISDSDCEELAESSVVKQFNEREVISDSDCEELAESSVVKQFNEREVISDSDCEELAESSVVKQFNEREVISDSDCEELAESSVVKQFNERELRKRGDMSGSWIGHHTSEESEDEEQVVIESVAADSEKHPTNAPVTKEAVASCSTTYPTYAPIKKQNKRKGRIIKKRK